MSGETEDSISQPRQSIEIYDDERAMNDDVIAVLAERSFNLYQREGELVWIQEIRQKDSPARKDIKPLSRPSLREMISGNVTFYSFDKEGERKKRLCPKWCYEAISDRGVWSGIRHLAGVVASPVLRQDGTICQTNGYDAETCLYLDLKTTFDPVPDRPTKAELTGAVRSITDIVRDFPFSGPEHRAAWVASLLTPLAREAYSGPTAPLFLFDANVRGAGKSLLADLVSLIVTGTDAPRFTNPKTDEEFRKRITAQVLYAPQMILIDNIAGNFGCPSLDAALTGTEWCDRALSTNNLVRAPLRSTWYASGNNVALCADTTRRTCHVRIESPDERPEERDNFKYPDVKKYVLQNRGRILSSALTILRSYFAAGRPNHGLSKWGSFEGWSDVVRSAVVFAGLPDPADTRSQLYNDADDDAAHLLALIQALYAIDLTLEGTRTGDMVRIASGSTGTPGTLSEPLRDAIENICDKPIDRITG
ncbi:MAG: hypothetical protein ABGZ53_14590 [Fuerstiella sp.]